MREQDEPKPLHSYPIIYSSNVWDKRDRHLLTVLIIAMGILWLILGIIFAGPQQVSNGATKSGVERTNSITFEKTNHPPFEE